MDGGEERASDAMKKVPLASILGYISHIIHNTQTVAKVGTKANGRHIGCSSSPKRSLTTPRRFSGSMRRERSQI